MARSWSKCAQYDAAAGRGDAPCQKLGVCKGSQRLCDRASCSSAARCRHCMLRCDPADRATRMQSSAPATSVMRCTLNTRICHSLGSNIIENAAGTQ